MLEFVQFKTPYKKELKQVAKGRGLTLNSLMVLIVDEYLKRVSNEK